MISSTNGLTFVTTQHFLKTVLAKNFNAEKILATFHNPRKITAVTAHPGQVRLVATDWQSSARSSTESFTR